ncbi:ATP-binding protein [Fodinisporobacter ferrooxydans]|uniref:histidine kinase n=1 Tax=Fodinisporobacter ferrooxydans TaxID=2901836 RepID=A0ABY4CH20_9BACL|nr:ATP-binding protein [Alicyclobacillaceae bacterium MYW30-H2]
METEPSYLVESRNRCKAAGLDPAKFPVPAHVLSHSQLIRQQIKYGEILSVARFFSDRILSLLNNTPLVILITDDAGYILEIYGDESMKMMMVQTGITIGIQMNEKDMGTNVISLSLQERKPIEIIGDGHYHHFLHDSACYGVPFSFSDINGLAGTVAIMTSVQFQSPFPLSLLSNMVDSMEREILLRRKNRTQHLLTHIMLNTLRSGIIITDKFGSITEFNQFAEQITCYEKKDVLCQSVFSLEPIGQYLFEVLRQGEKFEDVELTITNGSGQKFILLFDALPIYDDHHELMGAYAQFRDITDRCELEKQVIVSEKYSAIGKMAAGFAHEIRNPLTSIMGFMQLLMERARKTQQEIPYADIMYLELQRVNKLVTDFVLMAKPSVPDRKLCIAQNVLTETVQLMESQTILNGITLDTDFHTEPLPLFIDPIQMKQVFINVIQNAIEAIGSRRGRIVVSLKQDPHTQCAVIQIHDNGSGMTEDEIKHIVNPFFTTKEDGLGLGLSVSYRIIENHKGKISVSSEKGVGTLFTIQLPIHHASDC